MKINWFPGHMKSALDTMAKEMKNVDLIIYVLDSRAPFSCLNPSFDKVASKRPVIYVLSKCDLSDETETDFWKKYFDSLNYRLSMIHLLQPQNRVSTLPTIKTGANNVPRWF